MVVLNSGGGADLRGFVFLLSLLSFLVGSFVKCGEVSAFRLVVLAFGAPLGSKNSIAVEVTNPPLVPKRF